MFFLELTCFFDDPVDVGNFISGFSAFSKTSLKIWKFMVHVLLKAGLGNFEHYFIGMWDECNCAVVWVVSSSYVVYWNNLLNCLFIYLYLLLVYSHNKNYFKNVDWILSFFAQNSPMIFHLTQFRFLTSV